MTYLTYLIIAQNVAREATLMMNNYSVNTMPRVPHYNIVVYTYMYNAMRAKLG